MSAVQIEVDYIIIGCGLAAIAFAETCLSNNKSVIVFDNYSQNSSTIAAGIYNPIVLKRFTGLENAGEQLLTMNNFYKKLETKGIKNIDYKLTVLRKFTSIEEQNNWFSASDKERLAPFLSLRIHTDKHQGIDSPFDYGEVLQTGYVDTASLLKQYKTYLEQIDCFKNEIFDYDRLQIKENSVKYENISAKQIVFAEGFGIHSNPYFNYLPLDGTKGEILIIKAPELQLNNIINSSLYIVPQGKSLYKIGATYEWKDKTATPTAAGLDELTEKLNNILTCDYEIISHYAGIRPTVKDRKALLGTHYEHTNLHIINGLGTRGVMLATWCAEKLYHSIEEKTEIDKEINISRFKK